MTGAFQEREKYTYTDAAATPIYEVLRYEPKTFRQRRVDGHGGHIWGLDGTARVPYQLPDLLTAIEAKRTIVVVEGEKDADALRCANLVATTNAGGAHWPWTTAFVEYFRGADRVVVVCDCDAAGRKAGLDRAAVLSTVVDDVRLIDLAPDRADGYDVSDWLAGGHDVAELKALIRKAPRFVSDAPRERSPAKRALRVVSASDVPLVRPEWLEPGRIPLGTLTICDGLGGIGKTTVALTIIARATVGLSTFDERQREPINALIVAEEDDLGVLRAKLAVAGADLQRITFVDGSVLGDDVGSVRLPRDVPALRQQIEKLGAKIAYIDALFSHLELDGEGKMAHQMRSAIAPLARLARETNAAVIATRHWNKGAKSASDRGLGSGELSNVARSVLSFGRHPDSKDGDQRFVLAATKSNWSAKAPSIEYHLESVEVVDDHGAVWSVPRVVIRGIVAGISADDLAMAAPQDAEERDRLAEAQDIILDALSGGGLSAEELETQVRSNEVASRTFERARAKLRTSGRISREGGGKAGPVRWSLASTLRQPSIQIASLESGDEFSELAKSGADFSNASEDRL